MANVHLVTGYAGLEHITAADHAAFNIALFGSGQFVLGKGNRLAATAVTNNQIRVLDGDIYMQGRHIRLNEDTFVDLTVDSGEQGMKRNDLIVARYTRNASTGVEEVNLVVIKGTAAASNPADPAYTSGDLIGEHDLQNDMPLYRVPFDGLNIGEPVALFSVFDITIPGLNNRTQPISKGGTGATTAAAARSNLNVYSKGETYSKKEVLTEKSISAFGLDSTALPDDMWQKARTLISNNTNLANEKARISTGSYVGLGNSSAITVKLPFVPKIFIVSSVGSSTTAVAFDSGGGFAVFNSAIYGLSSDYGFTLTWGTEMKIATNGREGKYFNEEGKTYHYYAIG